MKNEAKKKLTRLNKQHCKAVASVPGLLRSVRILIMRMWKNILSKLMRTMRARNGGGLEPMLAKQHSMPKHVHALYVHW